VHIHFDQVAQLRETKPRVMNPMIIQFNRLLFAGFLLLTPMLATADLKVFACEPEWAALAEEIGGKLVKASSATNALQDPHYIQARPSLISTYLQSAAGGYRCL